MGFTMLMPALMMLSSLGDFMPTIYLICLIVGGGLLFLSVFFSFDGSESGVELDGSVLHSDLDIDLDGDGGSAPEAPDAPGVFSLSTWLSMRFLIYFAAAFGMVGVVLSKTTGMESWGVLGISAGSGIAVGQFVQYLLRSLEQNSGNSELAVEDYLHRLARVSVRIGPGQPGEIAVIVKSGERFLPAIAKREGEAFETGEIVGIVSLASGIAEVVSREESDFLNDTKGGIPE